MFRHAILIGLALLGVTGCARTTPAVTARGGCASCHETHYVEAGSCESCHRGDPDAARKELAHDRLIRGRAAEHRLANSAAVREGERLANRLACRRCHTIGDTGNRLAVSLDRAVWKREQSALERSIREPAEAMPRFALNATQREAIIAALLRRADSSGADPGYQVRFTRRDNGSNPRFEEACGGCHRALLNGGPAGRGSAGPNLSGLFTVHYPPSARRNERWTSKELREWLRNPRAVRSGTTMRPVALDDDSWSRLVAELDLAAGTNAVTLPVR